jgi:class 3 adenylate cyclase
VALLVVLLALPLAGLALLLGVPDLDREWEHHPSHFWLVFATAFASVVLAVATSEAARRRSDARVFLVSLSFFASAAFLGLHAIATPDVLLETPNAGFVLATPVGLVIAAAFAAASSLDLDERRAATVLRLHTALRGGLAVAAGAWAAVSLAGLPPLDEPLPPEEASLPLKLLAAGGLALFGIAAWRYLELYRRRPAQLLLAIVVAFVLLGEALAAIAVARNWALSWWEWHVLLLVAYGLVAWAVRREYREHASVAGAFGGLYLERTLEHVDRRHAAALDELVAALGRGESLEPVSQRLRRAGLSNDETAALEQAAREVRRIDDLFRPYLSPQLAARLEQHPELAELGGQEREVSVLFADLQGFTAFSERRRPAEVIALLNEYWGAAVPAIVREEGVIERFAGDAVMVVFNAAEDQPDHALRACRAALSLQGAATPVVQDRPDAPRFRVGVNTGPAIVGNVGGGEQRSFAAIGDTTNLAARLQGEADPGTVIVSGTTLAAVSDGLDTEPLGALELKGKSEPVEAFRLLGVR